MLHSHTPNSTAGLLISLANDLPDPACPIGRRARRVARRLSHGASTRALDNAAADLLARLLEAGAEPMPWDEDGLLCAEFDE